MAKEHGQADETSWERQGALVLDALDRLEAGQKDQKNNLHQLRTQVQTLVTGFAVLETKFKIYAAIAGGVSGIVCSVIGGLIIWGITKAVGK